MNAKARKSLKVRGVQILVGCFALVGALLIPAGAAQAQATVFRFSGSDTETFSAPLEGCLPPDLIGTVTASFTTTGQAVDTGQNPFAVHGVDTYDYHADFPNGIYVQSGLNQDHFTFIFNPPLTVNTVASQDKRTIYAADGTPIGTLSILETIHITFQDTNGNGQPDPGEITVQFDKFRLHCG